MSKSPAEVGKEERQFTTPLSPTKPDPDAYLRAFTKNQKKKQEWRDKFRGKSRMAAARAITNLITGCILIVVMVMASWQMASADENPFLGFHWIRGLDVPAFCWTTEGDKLAGPRWDGGLFVCPLILDNRVFYRDSEYCEWHFVWLTDLTSDPRDTDWWEKSRLNSTKKTLWGRVADAACSQDRPEVTRLIINDMIHSGATTRQEVDSGKMTSKRLDQIMLKYSEKVWD